ncbi:MAG: MarR family transcriptional regulator [Alphaproteobacteria bacterium]|nr:MarR family transcriptional regulator [Alphaproteobacteria bacterium]
MEKNRKPDMVDRLIDQWRGERPDLELGAMALIARLKRCSQLIGPRLDKIYREHDLSAGDFDVLATLRRSGEPYCLSPTDLFDSLLLTSGTMTHRLKKLEAKGWIQRLPNVLDARSLLVALTDDGFKLIDDVVSAHVNNEEDILRSLDADARARLDAGLRELLSILEAG